MPDHPLRASLIGVFRLVRHLRLPPARWERAVESLEASELFRQCAARIRTVRFPGAEGDARLPDGVIGQFQWREREMCILYRHPAWGREYVWEAGADDLPGVERARLCLRLVNTRSRLTHLMLMGLAQHQAAYLASGDLLDLEPLSQAALGWWIASEGDGRFLPEGSRLETIDASLISRAVRGLSLLTPQRQIVSLRHLMPSSRAVLQYRLKALLDEEAADLRRGSIEQPADDEALRDRLAGRWNMSVARRTVALARQALGIPASYRRDGHHTYPPREVAPFAPQAYPLTATALQDQIPAGPGVYEIALAVGEVAYPDGASPVVYLGRSRNLRKRLADHLRPGAKNARLGVYLAGSRCVVRYASTPVDDLQAVERALVRAFIETYGALPKGNRIQP